MKKIIRLIYYKYKYMFFYYQRSGNVVLNRYMIISYSVIFLKMEIIIKFFFKLKFIDDDLVIFRLEEN